MGLIRYWIESCCRLLVQALLMAVLLTILCVGIILVLIGVDSVLNLVL